MLGKFFLRGAVVVVDVVVVVVVVVVVAAGNFCFEDFFFRKVSQNKGFRDRDSWQLALQTSREALYVTYKVGSLGGGGGA